MLEKYENSRADVGRCNLDIQSNKFCFQKKKKMIVHVNGIASDQKS